MEFLLGEISLSQKTFGLSSIKTEAHNCGQTSIHFKSQKFLQLCASVLIELKSNLVDL